jgi:hypothetical protein
MLQAISKNGFWFQIATEPGFKPEAYALYVKDLKPGFNKGMGPKDFFE